MAQQKKPRSGPGSRTGANARSGPNVPVAQRHRRPLEITLSPEARELLDAEHQRTEESRSALVEALVLSHLQAERYLPPALVEQAQRLAARTGASLDLVLALALAAGLERLAAS